MDIEGLTLPAVNGRPGGLFDYQKIAVDRMINSESRFLFLNHSQGTGKTVSACAIIQELFNRDKIDLVLFFTPRKMRTNIQRAINGFTQITALSIDGVKVKRRKDFKNAPDGVVFVTNYERANFDFDILSEKVSGKRVLYVFDETQKILIYTNNKPNKAGQGIKKLVALSSKDSYILPLSATVIDSNPERYFRLFDYIPSGNPLGNITKFRKDYTSRTELRRTAWGMEITYIWDFKKLERVRDVVEPYCHIVRKSDPEVRKLFQDTQFIPIFLELSEEDRELYETIKDAGSEDDPDRWGEFYRILTYICGTAESLKHSESSLAKEIVSVLPNLSSKTSSKMEMLIDQVSSIKDSGDQVVVFTNYTTMSLFLISKELTRAGIKHVCHYGSGMTDKEAQAAQDDFKSDPSITVFLSSDAGALGLSLQCARYVINFNVPYSFDLLSQRNDRIDRADSYLENLTSYVYITENTIEERIWGILNERREMASVIQGTNECLGRSQFSEASNVEFLLFGDRK